MSGEVKVVSAGGAPAAKLRLLFVDDEASMLRILKIGMRSMTDTWEMEFAGSGEEALILVDSKRFDVIVTDMRMPGINGAQLLNHVLRNHPQTIRIVLSGYAELSEVVHCVGLTHQFLSKPCSLDVLKNCLHHITRAKRRLINERLSSMAGSLQTLPSLPEIYMKIAEALQSPSTSAERIADIASNDPAISAKMLQLANSAYFGFSRKVFSVAEAVQQLGVSIIQSLAMAVPIFSSFNRSRCANFPIEQVWEHSVQTGLIARQIFNKRGADPLISEQAFCSGVIHDIGKIILADNLPAEYSAIIKESQGTKRPISEIERKHLGATHAEVGAYLLALWGLPMPLVEAVANHHHPEHCGSPDFCLAGVVHVANHLQHLHGPQVGFASTPINNAYLQKMGLQDQVQLWQEEFVRPQR